MTTTVPESTNPGRFPWYQHLWVPQEAAGVYQALQDVDGQVRNWLLSAELSLRSLTQNKEGQVRFLVRFGMFVGLLVFGIFTVLVLACTWYIPPGKLAWQWKIHHEWTCICNSKMVGFPFSPCNGFMSWCGTSFVLQPILGQLGILKPDRFFLDLPGNCWEIRRFVVHLLAWRGEFIEF